MSEDILKALHAERSKLTQQMATVDQAIKLYGGSVSSGRKGKKKVFSAEHRAKIAKAAKARWAKVKKESNAKKGKKPAPASKEGAE